MTDAEVAPQVTFSVTSTIEKISDNVRSNSEPDSPSDAVNGIIFRHTGGDAISLDGIKVQISTSNKQMTFTLNTLSNSDISVVPDTYPVVKNGGASTYFSVGNKESVALNAGDYFILLADSCYDSTGATDASITKGKFLVWSPADSKGTFTAQVGKTIEYSIIDTASGNVLQRGTVKL